MRRIVYLIAVSADGFIAARDGSLDAFTTDPEYLGELFRRFPETCPGHLREALGVTGGNRRFDAVIMGRVTYAGGLDVGVTDPYPTLETYVASNTLASPDPRVTTVAEADLPALVERLRGQDGRDVWLAGGGALAAAMRDADLIDDVILKINPMTLGDGVPLFAGAPRDDALELVETTPLPAGVVLAQYRRAPRD